jgi:uncharacterized damage-inducible protein DinB
MKRPLENEYAHYYHGYISKVKDDDIIKVLEEQLQITTSLFNSLSIENENYRYTAGKWNVKEVLGHVIDAERVFSFRALAFARGETQKLPGFDQEPYVNNADFSKRILQSLKEEYENLRRANLALFKSFSEEMLDRKGIASNNEVTVRALIFIIAGHEKHHLDILKEKYSLSF